MRNVNEINAKKIFFRNQKLQKQKFSKFIQTLRIEI